MGYVPGQGLQTTTQYKYDATKAGSTCSVKAFFESINEIIGSLATVYVGALQEKREKIRGTTFRELLKVNPKDKKLQKLKEAIEILYNEYTKTMSSKNINKVWAWFGGLKTGKIKTDTKKDLIEKLDKIVKKSIKARSFKMI